MTDSHFHTFSGMESACRINVLLMRRQGAPIGRPGVQWARPPVTNASMGLWSFTWWSLTSQPKAVAGQSTRPPNALSYFQWTPFQTNPVPLLLTRAMGGCRNQVPIVAQEPLRTGPVHPMPC